MKTFTVNANDAGQRLDKYLSKCTEGMPKSLLYKYIRKKRVKVNGARAHEGDILSPGDTVELWIPDEFFREKAGSYDSDSLAHVKVKPEVIYEDENILLCDKRPGVLVHLGDEGDKNRAEGSERETLIYALTAYLAAKGEYVPENERSFAPALCNRIDRNTGGIVILAKNASALRQMNEAIRENRVSKRYLCAVHGKMSGEETYRAWHSKDYRTNTVRITADKIPGAKEIVTRVRALSYEPEKDLTLCEVGLVTGRTHQIRAHLAFLGHPLLGEGKYAKNAGDRRMGYAAQALCSAAVSFDFPESGDGADLTSLNGRVFCVNLSNIRFLSLFPGFDPEGWPENRT
ncbi:MAG: RluA family pseudouridine synthase [Ruminococcaceae bacterium]|jgi:23S rRNA pseudouridine955/2504/2580 synthase|nr:RluA family pseudouridine synthase [Oscillospiraceae bacterium]